MRGGETGASDVCASLPATLTAEVLAWGVSRLRDLPWRRTRDPWAVLVSEVMLQQTQVLRVIPRYESFLARFPTVHACASAPLGDVLREWQGLGYPRRARDLHATAKRVEQLGAFPRDLAGLMALPGVGKYTARALLAFAFELDAAVVDTNIARVYARVLGERLSPGAVQGVADVACPRGDAWVWNQCLMDLGAVLCRPTRRAATSARWQLSAPGIAPEAQIPRSARPVSAGAKRPSKAAIARPGDA